VGLGARPGRRVRKEGDVMKQHTLDAWSGGVQTVAEAVDSVKVHLWKGYGSLVITVTDEGNIVLDACDGEGNVLATACVDPEELVPVEDDEDKGAQRGQEEADEG
jgi:hypothetical protein